jgi:hypothetical protein
MPKYFIAPCRHCGKPCKGNKGRAVHERNCPPRPIEAVNTVAVHPMTEMLHGANRLWDTLSDGEKLFALALFMERSRGN